MSDKKPMLLVLAGPNGSGKSTITQFFEKAGTYTNADDYYVEIEEFLLENGILQENIYNKAKDVSTLYPKQYFDTDIIRSVEHEIFVDGGAYDLETTRKFIRFCDGHYDKIYSFEPDADNFRQFRSESDRASGVIRTRVEKIVVNQAQKGYNNKEFIDMWSILW